MFKFLENAPTSTIAMGAVTAASSGYIANLFKEDKVSDAESVAALVKKNLDSGDYARVSIKTGRRIG